MHSAIIAAWGGRELETGGAVWKGLQGLLRAGWSCIAVEGGGILEGAGAVHKHLGSPSGHMIQFHLSATAFELGRGGGGRGRGREREKERRERERERKKECEV